MSPTASVARAMQFDDLIDSKPDAPLPVPDEFVEQALSSVEPEPQLEVQPSIETQVATSTIELEDSAFVADVVVPAEAVRLHSWQQTNCAALQEIVSFCGVMVPRLAFSYLASFHDSTKDFAELKPQNPANTAIQMTQHASSVVIKQDTASTDVSDAVLARRERLLAGLNRNSQPVASSSSFASMAKSMSNRSARLSNAALSMQSNQSSVLSPKPEQSILNESKVDFMRDLAHSNAAQRTKLRLPLKHQDLLDCFRAVERVRFSL
jgi:phage gp37-like protein